MFGFLLLQVALTNLLMSSDNVLMIALMSGGVRRARRRHALLWSLLASVAAMLVILFLVAFLFRLIFLRSVFGLVICFMAYRLIQAHRPGAPPAAPLDMGSAVLRITTGNLMMSFENEAALIALAGGNVWLAWAGVLATAPLVFFGSHLIASLLKRYALIVHSGAVYLFSVGAGLVFSGVQLRPYATVGTWSLTALFAVYVGVRSLVRARSTV